MENYFSYNTDIGKIIIADNGKEIIKIQIINDFMEYKGLFETVLIKEAKSQLDEYLAGNRVEFNLPLAPAGTDFQRQVWNELLKIPYGQTRSYSDIAKCLNNPQAARAVGMANNKNPILIVIPCHRVIGKNGDLIVYGAGIGIKRFLLNLEK